MSVSDVSDAYSAAHRAEYVARVNRVIDHVERNLDAQLSLALLAEVANFSPYHFHRIFAALVGETLSQFVQRLRLEKAARLLHANRATDRQHRVGLWLFGIGHVCTGLQGDVRRERFGLAARVNVVPQLFEQLTSWAQARSGLRRDRVPLRRT